MTDNPLYSDFFDSNSSSSLKNQIMESLRDNPMLTTASMPIPSRRGDYTNEFGLLLDPTSNSPHQYQDLNMDPSQNGSGMDNYSYNNQQAMNNSSGMQMWNDSMMTLKTEPFQMDEDDIFQVDKSDLIQGPTLAELNDDVALLDDLNIDDLILPDEHFMYHSNQLHQLQPVILNNISLSPHNLLQIQNNSLNNSIQSGIAIGHDVLYEDQINLSSNSFDIYQSNSSSTPTRTSYLTLNSTAAFSPASQHSPLSQHSSSSSLIQLNSSVTPPPSSLKPIHITKLNNNNNFIQNNTNHNYSTLQNLLKKEYSMSPDQSVLGQSVPTAGPSASLLIVGGQALSPGGFQNRRHLMNQFHNNGGGIQNPSRLSSSAPTHLNFDHIWQRREPRQHLLSTGSLAEADSTSSLSTGGVLSPEAPDLSHDEIYSDDDDDSDHYEDYSSDNNNDSDDDTPKTGGMTKKERFFWQYNVQAKGPKGQRLVIKKQMEDPHVLNEVTDPVFSPHCSVRGIKVSHSGKARKGDGNDLTPNPRKLHNIGKELDKLGRIINDMTPVSELPFNVRPKTRKEKNKLASRACRLKKKAQHEANKIKLQGLEIEHRRLINGIGQIKSMIVTKCNKSPGEISGEDLNLHLDKIGRSAARLKVAGNSTEFVNKILEKVKTGVASGGLDDL